MPITEIEAIFITQLKDPQKLAFQHPDFSHIDLRDRRLAGGFKNRRDPRRRRTGLVSTGLTEHQFAALRNQSRYPHLKQLPTHYQGEIGIEEMGGIFANQHSALNTKYLTAKGRKRFLVSISSEGKLFNKYTDRPLNTAGMQSIWANKEQHAIRQTNDQGSAMYVMDPAGNFYVAPMIAGRFHHSSFLAGEPVAGAGEMTIVNGTLIRISNSSGHYRPDLRNMLQVLQELVNNNVNLWQVQLNVKYEGMERDNIPETGVVLNAGMFYYDLSQAGSIEDLEELQARVSKNYNPDWAPADIPERKDPTRYDPDDYPYEPEIGICHGGAITAGLCTVSN